MPQRFNTWQLRRVLILFDFESLLNKNFETRKQAHNNPMENIDEAAAQEDSENRKK